MKSALRNRLSAFVQRRIQADRRGGKRQVPSQRTLCLLQAPADEPATGLVQNVSFKGVGVVVGREYPFGIHLSIRLINASHTFSVARGMKVIRCIRLADNQYLIGGPFDRALAHDEVVPFLV